jgi:uncharacterized protein YaaN involved in tellurite resistance
MTKYLYIALGAVFIIMGGYIFLLRSEVKDLSLENTLLTTQNEENLKYIKNLKEEFEVVQKSQKEIFNVIVQQQKENKEIRDKLDKLQDLDKKGVISKKKTLVEKRVNAATKRVFDDIKGY